MIKLTMEHIFKINQVTKVRAVTKAKHTVYKGTRCFGLFFFSSKDPITCIY